MGRDYTGYLIVSDIDGTLVTRERIISRRNRDAIRRFTQGGGLFTVASGRSVSSIKGIMGDIPINCPVIAYNGSMIYDLQKETVILSCELSQEEKEYVRFVYDRFTESTVEIYSGGVCYLPRGMPAANMPIHTETVEIIPCRYDELPHAPWTKAAFTVVQEHVPAFLRFIEENPRKGVSVIASSGRYYEIIPAGHTKGTMLRRLKELVGVKGERVIAVGDYYNDLEMLKEAGVGVCVRGAPEDIRAVCAYEAGSVDEGVIGDILDHIDENDPA